MGVVLLALYAATVVVAFGYMSEAARDVDVTLFVVACFWPLVVLFFAGVKLREVTR